MCRLGVGRALPWAFAAVLALGGRGPALGTTIFDDDWKPPAATRPKQPVAVLSTVSIPATQPAATQRVTAGPGPTDGGKRTGTAQPPGAATRPQAVASRAVPPEAARARSRKMFSDLFARDLADHSAAGRRSLAQKLLDASARVADVPADQFVLMAASVQAAEEAGDLDLCCRAAETMAQAYDVDGLQVASDAALKMTLRSDGPAGAGNMTAGLNLVDRLAAAEDYTAASRLLRTLRAAAPDPTSLAEIRAKASRIEMERIGAERVAPFIKTLATTPRDPAANLAVGRYYCFIKEDWDRGLGFLANGSSPHLRAAAALDLAGGNTPEKQIQIGNAWWSVSEGESGPAQLAIRRRAVSAYKAATQGGNVTGLEGVLVAKRIAAVEPAAGTAASLGGPSVAGLQPGLIAELFQDTNFSSRVKKRIDRQIDFDWGKLGPDTGIEGGKFSIRWTGMLRVAKPADYTLTLMVDDAAEIWIDGKSVLSQPKASWSTGAEVHLSAGLHPIRIDYHNTGGDGLILLHWADQKGAVSRSFDRDALWHDRSAGSDAEPAGTACPSALIRDTSRGNPFREAAPPGTVLVGFEVTIRSQQPIAIKSIRAVYRGVSGEVLGAWFGEPVGSVTRVVARPGYAVGTVEGHCGRIFDRFSVRFMRVTGDALNPSDAYDSGDVGGTKGDQATLAGEGRPVIGIYGVASEDCHGLGLIMRN